jgi:uncharacterized protein YjbI with pentapeptide repeats
MDRFAWQREERSSHHRLDQEKAMNDQNLKNRWLVDPLFQQMYALILSPDVVPNGMNRREWFRSIAPRVKHPINGNIIDCRGINLDGLHIGEEWLNDVLDEGSFRGCVFDKTGFQSASAARCDFTGARFVAAQMSPLYAPNATFKDCVFERCFVQGWNVRGLKDSEGNMIEGSYSDLRGCNFVGMRATRTDFDFCDFRGARLSEAQCAECNFELSDFRGADLDRTQFTACKFKGAQFDDTAAIRTLVQQGGNFGVSAIVWITERDA